MLPMLDDYARPAPVPPQKTRSACRPTAGFEARVPEPVLLWSPSEVAAYAVIDSWLRGQPSKPIAGSQLAQGCGYAHTPERGLPRMLRRALTSLRQRGVLVVAQQRGRPSRYWLRKHEGRFAVATPTLMAALRSGDVDPSLFTHVLREQRMLRPDGISRATSAEYAARWGCSPSGVRDVRRRARAAELVVDVPEGLVLAGPVDDPYRPPHQDTVGDRIGRGCPTESAGVCHLEQPQHPSHPLSVGEGTHRYARAREAPRHEKKSTPMHRPDVARLLAQLPPGLIPPHYGMRVGLARELAKALDSGLGPRAVLSALDLRIDPASAGRGHVPAVRRALVGLRKDVTNRGLCAHCGEDEPLPGCPGCGPPDAGWSAEDQVALEAARAFLGVAS